MMRNTDRIAPLSNIIGGQRDIWAQYLRNRRWGSCPMCPTSVVQKQTFPEFCANTKRSDHHRTFEEYVEHFRLKKPQPPQPKPALDSVSVKAMHDIAMGAKFRGDCHDGFHQFIRNGRWGACVDCPTAETERLTFPELCANTARSDHHLTLDDLTESYKRELVQMEERITRREKEMKEAVWGLNCSSEKGQS